MKSHLLGEEGRKPTNLGGLRCEPLAWESSLIHNKSANPATPSPHYPSPGDAPEGILDTFKSAVMVHFSVKSFHEDSAGRRRTGHRSGGQEGPGNAGPFGRRLR